MTGPKTRRLNLTDNADKARRLRLVDELDRHPDLVITRLSRLHSEATEPLSSRRTKFNVFLEDFNAAVMFHMSSDTWDRDAKDLTINKGVRLERAGLVEACTSIVQSDDFAQWPKLWRVNIYTIIAQVIDLTKDNPDSRERICHTTARIFKSIWDRCDIPSISDLVAPGRFLDVGAMQIIPMLYGAYHRVYIACDRVPGLETYLPHVQLLVWVISREENEFSRTKLDDILATALYASRGPSLRNMQEAQQENATLDRAYWELRDAFVKECILEGIGADRFLDACETDLRSMLAHGTTGCTCENGVHDVRLLGRHILSAARLIPEVYRRDLLVQALDVLKQLFALDEPGEGMCTSLCMFCLSLVMPYYAYSEASDVPRAAPHRYADIVDLYVAAVELVAADCSESISEGDLRGTLAHDLHVVMKCIQSDIEAQGGRRPQYMPALRQRAALYWQPSFRRLQLAALVILKEHGPCSHFTAVSVILDQWLAFGILIGLDPDEERRRHEQDRRRCWWRGCQRKPKEEGLSAKLLQCAACGEARYCSKKCQALDWKTGGHKKMCGGRLK